MKPVRVHGFVVLPDDAPDLTGARLQVRLLDVTLADASASVLAEQTIPGAPPGERSVPFDLEAEVPEDFNGSLVVAAHVDVSGAGAVRPGDYLTTASHPVTPGDSAATEVHVRRVG